MKALRSALQWMLGILALAISVLAFSPTEWKQKLSTWSTFVHVMNSLVLTTMALFIVAFAVGLHYWSREQVVVWRTRKEWWDKKFPTIISASEKLVVIDSYQGSKHQFWSSIAERLQKEAPFHFTLLDLAKEDPMLAHCVHTSRAHVSVVDIDLRAIERLSKECADLRKDGNKIIEFGYWTGESAGPLVAWTIKGKESIATGLWQQVEGSTDLSPWLTSKRGPIFSSLKRHYESLLHKARGGGRVHSAMATQLSPPSDERAGITPERSSSTTTK